jgi:hypothetical protein
VADFATPEDVVARYRPLQGNESTVVQTWLTDASADLRVAITDVDERVLADPDYARAATKAVAMAVVRLLRGRDPRDPADYSTIFFTKSELAALTATGTSESSSLPSGSFPDALAWPDPVQCY